MSSAVSFSGLASGIDSSALIKSLLDSQRAATEKPLQDRISKLTDTNSAFSDMRDLLGKLQDAAAKFRLVNGGALAKIAGSSDETVATAVAANSAINGSYTLNVTQLAKNGTYSFNDRFSSSTSIINSNINNGSSDASRTVTVSVGTGSDQEDVDLVLTNTTTISDFVSSFNSQSTKATASVVNVGTSASPSYAVVINSNNQGTQKGTISLSVGSGVTDPNGDLSTADGAFTAGTSSAATDATFTVSGVSGTITRSSNAVGDVLDGVTVNLQSLGSAVVSVGDDSTKTASTVEDFVTAYNDLVAFVHDNNQITRTEDGGTVTNIFGPLASTSLDDNVLSALRGAFNSSGLTGRTVNILADIGITTQRDGSLAFDSDKFKSALADDSEGVGLLTQNLGETLSSIDGTISQFTRFNGLIDVASNSNSQSISDSQKRINDIEEQLAKTEASLTARYARLESLIGQLNQQQSTLAGILPR